GGDGADLGDGLFVVAGFGQIGQRVDGGCHGLVDTALDVHRVHAGGNGLHAFTDNGLGQYRGGGGAVTGIVGGLGSDFLDHLHTHVFELVFQFDFLGDRDTVLGDGRGAEALVEHDIAALRAQRHLDGVGQCIDTGGQTLASIFAETYFLSSHYFLPLG